MQEEPEASPATGTASIAKARLAGRLRRSFVPTAWAGAWHKSGTVAGENFRKEAPEKRQKPTSNPLAEQTTIVEAYAHLAKTSFGTVIRRYAGSIDAGPARRIALRGRTGIAVCILRVELAFAVFLVAAIAGAVPLVVAKLRRAVAIPRVANVANRTKIAIGTGIVVVRHIDALASVAGIVGAIVFIVASEGHTFVAAAFLERST